MKKLVLFFVILCVSIAAMAQGHMTFKGVEINGSLSEMVIKLKAKEFAFLGTEDGVALMEGDFAGYSGCQIEVFSMKETGKVNAVGVFFPKCEEWSSIEADYDKLKSMLTEKYGMPNQVVEKFQSDFLGSNGLKFAYLMTDQCTWKSVFETPNGTIELFMQKAERRRASVVLKYYDKANSDVARSAAMDDL